MTRLHAAGALLIVCALMPARAAAQSPIDLQQNWDDKTRNEVWFTNQGSRLVPYAWFLALEQPGSTTPFRDSLERFGYIPARSSSWNPDGLPIGFTRDVAADGRASMGLTCAACHTGMLRIDGTPVIVEGAPAGADFNALFAALMGALDETQAGGDKATRFADKVLGSGHTPAQKEALLTDVRAHARELRRRWFTFPLATPTGPGRVDAFGNIYNQVVAYNLDLDANARPADAPVSYPFLWDTPQHNTVQWNGSASNGLLGHGPVFRNIGEVLGVFGYVNVTPSTSRPHYPSSLRVGGLKRIEDHMGTLWSPRWPENRLPIDRALAKQGAGLYDRQCSSCHKIIDRTSPSRRVVAQMKDVGTDQKMALNFFDRLGTRDGVATGRLRNTPIFLLKRFGDRATGAEVLMNAIVGGYRGRSDQDVTGLEPTTGGADAAAKLVAAAEGYVRGIKRKTEYKARPLNGIWATAPYLHNGSVPTLWELLKPPAQRPTSFRLGSRDLDAADVGFPHDAASGDFIFDATKPGNLNAGHAFGTTLTDREKRALIEFLKTL